MIWRKDKPKNIGEYIILIPAFTSPFPDSKEPMTCSVHKAWFDGNCFIFEGKPNQNWEHSYLRPENCLWVRTPKVYPNGKYSDCNIDFNWVEETD